MTRLMVLSFIRRSNMMGRLRLPSAARLFFKTGAAYCTVRNHIAIDSPTVSPHLFRKKFHRNLGERG